MADLAANSLINTPAPDRDIVNGEMTHRHYLLQVAIRKRIMHIPASAKQNDHVFEMSPAERCWPPPCHDTRYEIGSDRFATHLIYRLAARFAVGMNPKEGVRHQGRTAGGQTPTPASA